MSRFSKHSVVSILGIILASLFFCALPVAWADQLEVELVGHWEGVDYAVAVHGQTAYVGAGPRVFVLDVSSPAQPVLLGYSEVLPSIVNDIALAWPYAYVATGDGLHVVDVSSPTTPIAVGHYTPTSIFDLAVAGSFAYAAEGNALEIIDISDPAAPAHITWWETDPAHGTRAVAVVAPFAYVADWFTGLHVLDVSDPDAPERIGGWSFSSGYSYEVAVSGSYAYVAQLDAGLQIINVANPEQPFWVAQADTNGNVGSVSVAGQYAYVADHGVGLCIINVSDPEHPSQPHYWPWSLLGNGSEVRVSGSYAYVAGGRDDVGFHVIDVTNVETPQRLGGYNTGGQMLGIEVTGPHAYVADGYGGLDVFDVSDPETPQRIGNCDTPGEAFGIAVAGSYAFVGDMGAGLQIIDVSNPANPALVGEYNTDSVAWRVAVAAQYAYVADGADGLQIINVSSPTAPQWAGAFDTYASAFDVAVSGTHAYVMDPYIGLYIVNVSNLPTTVGEGFYPADGGTYIGAGVTVVDPHAFLADGTNGLKIVNVSNPGNPELVGGLDTDFHAVGVTVAPPYAFLASSFDVQIINVSNVAQPLLAGHYYTDGSVYDVAVVGQYAYVADYGGGLVVLHFYHDCNDNDISDEDEIASGTSLDCNANGIPDECDLNPADPDGDGQVSTDCNDNGVPDECDIAACSPGDHSCADCNNNGLPDACDIWIEDGGLCQGMAPPCSRDLAGPGGEGGPDGVPDECEYDCEAHELAMLLASDPEASDYFSYKIAVDGDTAVISTPWEDHGSIDMAGAAYVFVRIGGVWTEQAKLVASVSPQGSFGFSVALAGDTLVVGAPIDDGTSLEDVGSAFVFVRTEGVWTQEAKLTASDAWIGDSFGRSVATDGDTVLVGADGDDISEVMTDTGAVYVFSRPPGGWSDMTETAKLTASDAAEDQRFGVALALDDDAVVIGANNWNDGTNAGSAYVFVRSGEMWTQQAKLVADDGPSDNYFGYYVGVAGDTALIGATGDDNAAGIDAGAAYVFVKPPSGWANMTESVKLMASDAAADDGYGTVAIDGDIIVVGAHDDDHQGGSRAGSAYVYVRSGGSWAEQVKLTASDAQELDWFGISVALDGGTLVIGAQYHDLGGELVNAGSAYVFGGLSDCNSNGVIDICELQDCPPNEPWCADCNNNGVLDECDIAIGGSAFADPDSWAAFDAGASGVGNVARGYSGAVFDGRYIYFVPRTDGTGSYHSEVLRYDTDGSFTAPDSWSAYDPGAPCGYSGGVFDGRYVYFAPYRSAGDFEGDVLRYDTLGGFEQPLSWDLFDPGDYIGQDLDGFEEAVFDGRYVYFVPSQSGTAYTGEVLRYDTQGVFSDLSAWRAFDASTHDVGVDPTGFCGAGFDGRYVYFVPHENDGGRHGEVLRYDTTAEFSAPASWEAFDPGAHGVGVDPDGYKGSAAYDGRYLYFSPYHNGTEYHGEVLRYDTQAPFTDAGSWQTYVAHAYGVGEIGVGYSGAIFDGRFVYFAPNRDAFGAHGEVLCYFTGGDFTDPTSWMAYSPSENGVASYAAGYWGGGVDGDFIYFAPYILGDGNMYHGEVLRFDAPAGSFDCNGNGIPDECEWADCNENGVLDACDIDPTDPDGNGLVSADCIDCEEHSGAPDGIPDECQEPPDCPALTNPINSTWLDRTLCNTDPEHLRWCWETAGDPPANWCPPLVPDNGGGYTFDVTLSGPDSVATLNISPTLTSLALEDSAAVEVNANSGANVRYLAAETPPIHNAGIIRAREGKRLVLDATDIDQTGTPAGILEADGTDSGETPVPSKIQINGETVTGGIVRAINGGQIELLGGAQLNGVTIEGGRGDSSVVVPSGQYGQVAATINNQGGIAVGDGLTGPAFLFAGGTQALLAGDGKVKLGSNNALLWISSDSPLTNGFGHTIEGFGWIFGSPINDGLIQASDPQQTLYLGSGGAIPIINNCVLRAVNEGILRIRDDVLGSGMLTVAGGTVIVGGDDEPVIIDEDGPVIVDPGSAGLIEVRGSQLLGAVYWEIGNEEIGPDKTATLNLLNESVGVVLGPVHVHQNGTLRITNSSLEATGLILDDGAELFVSSNVTLSGSLDSGMTDASGESWSWAAGSDLVMTGGLDASATPCSLEGWSMLEAVSADTGPAGGHGDFEFADIILADGAHVSLVDHRPNHAPPVVAEAVYCDSLTLGAGAVLNLNGHNLYVGGFLMEPGPSGTGTVEDVARVSIHGDFDGDEEVTLDDVPAFVAALLQPEADPASGCRADVDEDGHTDGRDIQAFVDRLLGP